MPTIDEQLQKKKLFKKKSYRSYLSLDETLDDLSSSPNEHAQSELKISEEIRETATGLVHKQVTIGEQSDNKQVTIGEQSDNKQVTIGEQSDNKQVTIGEQNKRTVNKRVSQPITSGLTNGEQSDNKRLTKTSFFELVGLQRKVTLYVYESCKITRSAISASITLESMSLNLQSPKGSIKTTTNRLREKGVIETVDQKEGRGGFTKYRLNDSVYKEILHDETVNNRITNGEQSDNKRVSQPITQPITASSSSSSINVLEDFKTTTTAGTKLVGNSALQMNREWLEIDSSALSEIHFGQPQLSQIAQLGKLTPAEVQNSIDAFAFDLRENQKAKSLKTSPLNFFMGILRRGMPYAAPENYESPEDEARRKYLESKRAQLARRQAMEKEILELEFEEWMDGLTREDRLKYAPDVRVDGSDMQKGYLKNYFEKHLYSKRSNNSRSQGVHENASVASQQEELTVEQVRVFTDAQFGPANRVDQSLDLTSSEGAV